MKTRIIQTRFYDDEFVSECDLYTQHLYLYLLTCQYINICGIFQLPENKIKFEAKLTDLQFDTAKDNLQKADKVQFKDGWIYVKNARKNNNYEKSPLNTIACENELLKVPEPIKKYFSDSSIDSSIYTTQKQETINKKPKTINKKPEEVREILNYFKEIYEIKSLPNQLVQLGCAEWLFNEKGLDKSKKAIFAAYKCRGQQFAPSINSLMDLRDKYGKLEEFYYKKGNQNGQGRVGKI